MIINEYDQSRVDAWITNPVDTPPRGVMTGRWVGVEGSDGTQYSVQVVAYKDTPLRVATWTIRLRGVVGVVQPFDQRINWLEIPGATTKMELPQGARRPLLNTSEANADYWLAKLNQN